MIYLSFGIDNFLADIRKRKCKNHRLKHRMENKRVKVIEIILVYGKTGSLLVSYVFGCTVLVYRVIFRGDTPLN